MAHYNFLLSMCWGNSLIVTWVCLEFVNVGTLTSFIGYAAKKNWTLWKWLPPEKEKEM